MDTENTLPTWMTPAPAEPRERKGSAVRALEVTQFEQAFDYILEQLSAGKFLSSAVRDYAIEIDYGRLLTWIRKDSERWRMYCEAQQVGGEIIAARLADPEIEEARTIPTDANLRRVNFEIGKWYLGVIDRKRFAETKQIEVNQSISITAALAQANARVIEHEVIKAITVEEESE